MGIYRWQPGGSPRHQLRRIARHQVERGLDDLGDPDRHAAVHAVRKRGKKIRALLRLVRPATPELYGRENAAFRDATRRIAADRDAAVALATYDALMARYADGPVTDGSALARTALVRTALVERRDGVLGEDLERRLEAVRADLERGLERIETWELEGEGFDVVAGGLAKTYARARARMQDAYDQPSSPAFHEWRKRVKYHRYQVRLLQELWPEVLKARRSQLHDLSDLLGDDHDLAVLREDLLIESERYGGEATVAPVCALLDRRRAELQAHARTLGERCFAESPKRFVARMGTYWQAAQDANTVGPLVDATVPGGR